MRTYPLVPSHMAAHAGVRDGRPVGIVTLVGTGEFHETIVELVLDLPALAGLEASLSEVRAELRTASAPN